MSFLARFASLRAFLAAFSSGVLTFLAGGRISASSRFVFFGAFRGLVVLLRSAPRGAAVELEAGSACWPDLEWGPVLPPRASPPRSRRDRARRRRTATFDAPLLVHRIERGARRAGASPGDLGAIVSTRQMRDPSLFRAAGGRIFAIWGRFGHAFAARVRVVLVDLYRMTYLCVIQMPIALIYLNISRK